MIISLLVACLPQNSALVVDTPEPTSVPTIPTVTPPMATPAPPTSVVVGEDGGDFEFEGGILVTVPASPGADPVTLTVVVVPEGVPAPYVGLSDHLVFGPADVTFDPPLTISIPFTGADADARVFWEDANGQLVERVDAVIADGVATFEVSSLTRGFVAEPLPTDVTVPPDGGTFLFEGGVEVVVPAGASADPFTLTVDLVADGVPAPYVGMSEHIDLGPDGLVLDVPLSITLPFVGDDADARVHWGLPDGDFEHRASAVIANGAATFDVQVLTSGFVAEPITALEVPISGGTFEFDGGVTFTVPVGGVATRVTVTVEPDPAGVPAGFTGVSPVLVFGPADLAFDAPVTLELPYTGADDDVRLYLPNGDGGWIQEPWAVVQGGVATVEVTSLPAGAFLGPNAPVESVVALDPATPSDVLFVVDDSCSMSEEQLQIGNDFPSFLSYLTSASVDFHVGVTTTDMQSGNPDRGRLRAAQTAAGAVRYLDSSTADPAATFAQMANAGTDGSYDEQGRSAAYATLETNRFDPANAGFLRDDAHLHIVYLSDEEDQSFVSPNRQDFRTWMQSTKAAPYRVESHAIVGLPGLICPAVSVPGTEYIQYANWTGGIVYDLCNSSWVPFMEELGERVAGRQAVFASALPIDDSEPITVTVEDVNGAVVVRDPDTYVVSDYAITLDPPAEPGQIVRMGFTPL